MRIGILGTSQIAYRRFLPAVLKSDFEFAGIASRDFSRAKKCWQDVKCVKFNSYLELIKDKNTDALYLPLPPNLHFEYAKIALEHGKHIMIEKPLSTSLKDTKILCELAEKNKLTIFENYMFLYHKQIQKIQELLPYIGQLRLIRANFSFPFRGDDDFRYKKEGGGALLDCGGYTIKALEILKLDFKLTDAKLINKIVDIYGCVTCKSENGVLAQLAFGMDNFYKCEIEILGQNGRIFAPRVFTAPSDFDALVLFETQEKKQEFYIKDDSFLNSINDFYAQCEGKFFLKENILKQASFIEKVKNASREARA